MSRRLLVFAVLLFTFCLALIAQPPLPQPDAVQGNIWYGAIPPNGAQAPLLVFIHGLGGTANYFWINNDMYTDAYNAGYRTAFISMNADNSPGNNTIAVNGIVVKNTIPTVARHFATRKMYLIGHSKGGLDLQFAMANYPAIRALVKAVFTLGTPNQGSQMADWAFGPGKPYANSLGLLTPGMASLKVANVQTYRSTFDPVFSAAGIPFFYLAGNSFVGNSLTALTGPVLFGLSGQANDGLVAPSEAPLPPAYATTLGVIPDNHFLMGTGSVSFTYVQPQIVALESH
jgi:pimeloyl-ACP methyl ester carboxylesterase